MPARVVTSLLVACLVAAPASAGAQTSSAANAAPTASTERTEEGRPFVRTYQPVQVGSDTQNWAMVQDARGVLYVGNNFGVAEYDGVGWRLIELPNGVVRSLAIDAAGTIYVGAQADFGFLAPGTAGGWRFVSLRDKLPPDVPPFSDVWRAFATKDGVYFVANQAIFRWSGGTMTVIKAASRFNRASWVHERLYVPLPESGLNVLEGDRLRPLPGTLGLGREVMLVVLPYDDRRLLIGTRSDGLFLYDGDALTPFASGADDALKTGSAYRGTVLPDGTFAIATLSRGLVVLDRTGRQVLSLDKPEGLPASTVTYVMPDREGGMWVATQSGLARIEYPSAATTLGAPSGYDPALFIKRHAGRLYATRSNGVAYLEPGREGHPPRFVDIPGLGRQCWWLEDVRDATGGADAALALACNDGLFELRGTKAIPIRAPQDGTFSA